MSKFIKYNEEKKQFNISTQNTSYVFGVIYDKYVEHLYYGEKTDATEFKKRSKWVDFSPYPREIGYKFCPNLYLSELSFYDSGDFRETAVKIKNKDGDCVTDFWYVGYNITSGREELPGLPFSRHPEETLEIIYEDKVSGCKLSSYYSVFPESDTITRYIKITNEGSEDVTVLSAIACQLDIPFGEYERISLPGKYCFERTYTVESIPRGVSKMASKRGQSSHYFNPFMALKSKDATEYSGDAYGMNLVYSGDFVSLIEKTHEDDLRILQGLNPETFSWVLEGGESFTTPESVMSYSGQGTNKLSQNFHDHIRLNIIPEKFRFAKRPVVINSWEAMYFSLNEKVLWEYAEKAKALDIDTLVIDDGWFGVRHHDRASLGDWFVNREKFPQGIKALEEKVHGIGLNFGIWIEPEMINEDSDLFRSHPDWLLTVPSRTALHSRNQIILDLTRDEAVRYLVTTIKNTFDGVKLDYIKWDFNRSLAQAASSSLEPKRQGEARHRFMLGSYKLHKALTEAFPDTLFEGCSGGGGRFDLGILFYCPQIWTSDNTDPIDRIAIQKGTAFAYPMSAISAHVSNTKNNDIEGEKHDYTRRYSVAASGVLGYEMNILRLSPENEELVRGQVEDYKDISPLVLEGDYYISEGLSDEEYGFALVSKDKESFVAFYYSEVDNSSRQEKSYLKVHGLDIDTVYTVNGKEYSAGELLETGIEIGNIDYLVIKGTKQ